MSEPENPWETIKENLVFQNPYLTVWVNDVIRPDGEPGSHFRLSRGRTNQIVAVDERGGIIIVGQWRYATGRYSWELPGGHIDDDEGVLRAAEREFGEEVEGGGSNWEELGTIDLLNGAFTDKVDILFTSYTSSSEEASGKEEEGIDNQRIVSPQEFVAMVHRGEISNPPSIAGFFLYATKKLSVLS